MHIKTETKVGLFVIIAFVMFGYMANYLTAFNWHLSSYGPYTVLFKNVAGLTKKADVKIAGVKVGWVENIKLTPDGMNAEAHLMINKHYQIYLNAHVEICQDGLLGTKFVEIAPGNFSNGVIAPGSNLPIIGSQPTSIDDLVHKFDDVAKNIDLFITQLAPISNDLSRVTQRIDQVLDHNLETMSSIIQKIDQGTGSLGKLLNEDELYNNLKHSSNSLKQVALVYDNLGWVVDSHLEAFGRPSGGYAYKNAKSYLGARLHLNKDWYALFQLVGSDQGGVVDRDQIYTSYFNANNRLLTPEELQNLSCAYSVVPAITKEAVVQRNTLTYSLQFGKLFAEHFAFRLGLFENYFGMAFDCDIPFDSDNIRWVSSLEMFDFKGQNRLDDRRPHLKWLNKVFLFQSCYFAFGLDDFVSRHNINPFFGMGIRFGGYD